MYTDIHSHILPCMDDGPSDVKGSLRLLKKLSGESVGKAVLTPHFYRQDEDIQSFLERRQRSYEKLSEEAKKLSACPEMLLGAEVHFYPSLASDPDFGRLCIENTDYVMLELPFRKFDDKFFMDFFNFMNRCRQNVILAHIERYFYFGNTAEDIARLTGHSKGVLCQMNCSSLAKAGFLKRKALLGLISDGYVSALGTDAHGIPKRPPQYSAAKKIIISSLGEAEFERICRKSEMILANASPADVLSE